MDLPEDHPKKEGLEAFAKYISILHRKGQQYLVSVMEPYNLSSTSGLFLIYLYEHEGTNQRFLSSMLSLDQGLATRTMRELIRKGFATRTKDPEDARSYQLWLTEQGLALAPTLKAKLQLWWEQLTVRLSPQDTQQMMTQLRALAIQAIEYSESDGLLEKGE